MEKVREGRATLESQIFQFEGQAWILNGEVDKREWV
jgi:hypothetical protein